MRKAINGIRKKILKRKNSKKKFKKNILEKTLKHLKGVVDILFENSTFSPRNCSKFNFVH